MGTTRKMPALFGLMYEVEAGVNCKSFWANSAGLVEAAQSPVSKGCSYSLIYSVCYGSGGRH